MKESRLQKEDLYTAVIKCGTRVHCVMITVKNTLQSILKPMLDTLFNVYSEYPQM